MIVCALCGNEFEPTVDEQWNDYAARAELDQTFPSVPVEECVIICDDCFREVMPVICDCCRREVDSVRSGPAAELWFGDDCICRECFIEWYDPSRPTGGTDESNKRLIGDWVRKQHGLAPLEGPP